MTAAMIKHSGTGKGYWFEVPDDFELEVQYGVRVTCDTAIGEHDGTVTAVLMSPEEYSVRNILISDGAEFPLRKVISIERLVPIEKIKVPMYMAKSKPSDKKLAERFLEYYHYKKFDTKVEIDKEMVLTDGYTAYKVAKMLHLPYLRCKMRLCDKK